MNKNNLLEYRGFYGTVEYSAEDDILFGKVVGVPNLLIMYDGDSLESLKKDFMESIDFHLLPDENASISYDVRHELSAV